MMDGYVRVLVLCSRPMIAQHQWILHCVCVAAQGVRPISQLMKNMRSSTALA